MSDDRIRFDGSYGRSQGSQRRPNSDGGGINRSGWGACSPLIKHHVRWVVLHGETTRQPQGEGLFSHSRDRVWAVLSQCRGPNFGPVPVGSGQWATDPWCIESLRRLLDCEEFPQEACAQPCPPAICRQGPKGRQGLSEGSVVSSKYGRLSGPERISRLPFHTREPWFRDAFCHPRWL